MGAEKAGTTAAGLRAEIPAVIVPHTIDQPFWGKRVAAISTSAAPIDLALLFVERLAAALAQATNPILRARTCELGELIRAEGGVGEAVGLIGQLVANPYYPIRPGSLHYNNNGGNAAEDGRGKERKYNIGRPQFYPLRLKSTINRSFP